MGTVEIANYSYDALGRRIKSVEGGGTTLTLYSGNDVVYEVETPPTGPATTTCYVAANGKYLAKTVREGQNPPETFFLHTDQVGSIRAITDSTGQVVARFEYEPFGLTTLASGALAGETHKFTGKPEDGTGLYYSERGTTTLRSVGSCPGIRSLTASTGHGLTVGHRVVHSLLARQRNT